MKYEGRDGEMGVVWSGKEHCVVVIVYDGRSRRPSSLDACLFCFLQRTFPGVTFSRVAFSRVSLPGVSTLYTQGACHICNGLDVAGLQDNSVQ